MSAPHKKTLSEMFNDFPFVPAESPARYALRTLTEKYKREMTLNPSEDEISFGNEDAMLRIRADLNEDLRDVFVGTLTTFVPTREWINTGYCFTPDEALTRLIKGYAELGVTPISYPDEVREPRPRVKKGRTAK